MKKLAFIWVLIGMVKVCTAEPMVAVTIYNDNLALVRQVRDIEFSKGVQEYKYVDVAAQIDPTSVHFKSLSDPTGITLLEQNFEYDLVGTDRLLQKYIDQSVIITIRDGGTEQGLLLSAAGGDVVIRKEDGQIRAVKSTAIESIIFPHLPEGLITRPTLSWLLNATKSGAQTSELSYLTSGINWHAEYVAVVNEQDTQLDLAGWVSIENNSGATYTDAKLKLVAGDVNRVREAPIRPLRKEMYAMAADAEAGFAEREFFEYHLYTLQRPATIRDKQVKQVSLFAPQNATVLKVYSYDGARDGKKVKVTLEFDNKKENGLGLPLPKGKVRVYKNDSDGSQEFIGEDAIDHTPKDETVRLTMGNAFDIVGERVEKEMQRISKRSTQQTIQIALRNHKKEPVNVTVIEHWWGAWQLVGPTPPVKKKTADRVEFTVAIPADGEKTFEYTVLSQY
ncbi:DUF4139 domain-containing protein [candidate division KSB1 bacterium]|nr:DUF4139 domain-containing protein [candidate division KSB1 bacterium]RQW01691.1 MAG: DUF4139 domain-containing protein [candidate division KSB1 bacterium]